MTKPKVPSYTLSAPLSEQDWRARAACHGLSPLMWDETGTPQQRTEGILICNTLCPVSRECLTEGIESGAEGTVRGGVLIGVAVNRCGYCGAGLARGAASYCDRNCHNAAQRLRALEPSPPVVKLSHCKECSTPLARGQRMYCGKPCNRRACARRMRERRQAKLAALKAGAA